MSDGWSTPPGYQKGRHSTRNVDMQGAVDASASVVSRPVPQQRFVHRCGRVGVCACISVCVCVCVGNLHVHLRGLI